MLTFQSDVTIDRPPEVVFPYLVEPELQAKWSDVPMRKVTEGPLGPGSRMELSFGQGPIHTTIGLELTEVETGKRMAFTTYSTGPVFWDGEYRLEPIGSTGTRISQTGTLRFTGWWRLLEPIVGAEIKSGEIKELERLKSILEAPA